MRKFLSIFIVTGLFFSCQREEADAPFATDTDISVLPNTETKASDNGLLGWVALTGQTHISAEEAQETALATAMQMREVEGIVTKAPLKIGSVEVVKGDTRKPYVPTKGNAKPEQAEVYIVNFANNQGYVITSADRRIPSVLAYNSYGHLGDTITNPGQAILFSYMQAYIEEQRAAFEANKEKLATEAEEAIFKQLSKERQAELIAQGLFDKEGKRVKSKFEPDEGKGRKFKNFLCIEPDHYKEDIYIYGEWKTDVIGPLVKTLWSQENDYNEKVSMQCGNNKAPVGCVATALGQLIAYHKKPAVFKGRTMHWDDITKVDAGAMFSSIDNYSVGSNPTAVEDIQYLLAHLGDSDLLAMNYKCDGSGSSRALEALHTLGYNSSLSVSYNNAQAISEIKNNRPVYIEGCSTEVKHKFLGIHYDTSYEDCHAWILDGFVVIKRKKTHYYKCSVGNLYVFESEDGYSLVHNNLGWGGSTYGYTNNGSGWYLTGFFNTKKNSPSNTYKSQDGYDFKYKNSIIINIK
ncbi:C10 family peptidase [Capnocytophaga ochracea]|uniref:C10 family peptidase n=1 Tax=Capnocytophaga ochracea TaxID=1018 RepID=A0AA46WAA7_CAPOC|nr:C10 family peptidase [Capnocytophaga ochracea]UZD41823.1 C10 family peptidase [Capnocytophaga ochracea]